MVFIRRCRRAGIGPAKRRSLLGMIRSPRLGRAARYRRRLRDARRAHRQPPRRDRPRRARAARTRTRQRSCVLRRARARVRALPDDLTGRRRYASGDRRGVCDSGSDRRPSTELIPIETGSESSSWCEAGRAGSSRRRCGRGNSISARRRSTRTPSARASGFTATLARRSKIRDRLRRRTAPRFTSRSRTFTESFRARASTERAAMRGRMRDCVTVGVRTQPRRISKRASSSSCKCGARSEPRSGTSTGCWRKSAGAVRSARPRGSGRTSSSSGRAVRRLHRPARSRRALRRCRRRRLQDRQHRHQRRRSIAKRCVASRTFSFPSTTGRARKRAIASRKLVLIPLKDALLDVEPIVVEVGKTIRLDDLERSKTQMIELSARALVGEDRALRHGADAVAVHLLRLRDRVRGEAASRTRSVSAVDRARPDRKSNAPPSTRPLDACFAIVGAAGTGKSTTLARAARRARATLP